MQSMQPNGFLDTGYQGKHFDENDPTRNGIKYATYTPNIRAVQNVMEKENVFSSVWYIESTDGMESTILYSVNK